MKKFEELQQGIALELKEHLKKAVNDFMRDRQPLTGEKLLLILDDLCLDTYASFFKMFDGDSVRNIFKDSLIFRQTCYATKFEAYEEIKKRMGADESKDPSKQFLSKI